MSHFTRTLVTTPFVISLVACGADTRLDEADAALPDAQVSEMDLPVDAGAHDADATSSNVDGATVDAATVDAGDAGMEGDAGLPCESSLTIADGQGSLFEDVTCIEGDLTIETDEPVLLPLLWRVSGVVEILASPAELSFPALVRVDGRLHVNADNLTDLELPVLRQAKAIWIETVSPSLRALTLPALESAEQLEIWNEGEIPNGLRTVNLPRLSEAEGIDIRGLDLQTVKLPALTASEWFVIAGGKLSLLNAPLLRSVTSVLDVYSLVPLAIAFPALEEAGSVWLTGGSAVELAKLRTVSEELTISEMVGMTSLELPSLVSVSMVHLGGSPDLTRLSFPVLSAAHSLYLYQMTGLTEIHLDGLVQLDHVELQEADALERFSLPALQQMTSVELIDCGRLAEVSFPALQRLDKLSASDAPELRVVELGSVSKLTSLVLGSISTTSHELFLSADQLTYVSSLFVAKAGLSRLSLPRLVEIDEATIERNEALTELDFAALAHIHGRADIRSCHQLSRCKVEAINTQLSSGQFYIDDLADCDAP